MGGGGGICRPAESLIFPNPDCHGRNSSRYRRWVRGLICPLTIGGRVCKPDTSIPSVIQNTRSTVLLLSCKERPYAVPRDNKQPVQMTRFCDSDVQTKRQSLLHWQPLNHCTANLLVYYCAGIFNYQQARATIPTTSTFYVLFITHLLGGPYSHYAY